jgi:hypothetical protein
MWTCYPLPPPGGFLILPGAGTPPPTEPIVIPPDTQPVPPPDLGQPGPPVYPGWPIGGGGPSLPIQPPNMPGWPVMPGYPVLTPPGYAPVPGWPALPGYWPGGGQGGGAPQPPLGFWGPNDPRPTLPIYMPGFPGGRPPYGPGGPGTEPPAGVQVMPVAIWMMAVPADQVPPFPGIAKPPADSKPPVPEPKKK